MQGCDVHKPRNGVSKGARSINEHNRQIPPPERVAREVRAGYPRRASWEEDGKEAVRVELRQLQQ